MGKNKKKSIILTIVIILSFLFLFTCFYETYFLGNLYFKNFNDELKVKVFSKYKPAKEIACYGNKIRCKKLKYDIRGSVNTDKIGTYNVTYLINYKKKSYKKTKKIEVIDDEKPSISFEGEFDHVCPNGKVENVIIKATDNYDGDITDKIKYKIDGNKIIYKVEDSSGNVYEKEIESNINDDTPPTIILSGDSTVYLGVSGIYEEKGYVAIDNCDDDITKDVIVSGSVDSSKKGDYKLIYKVKDSSGNESYKERVVKVFERNNYHPESLGDKVVYLTFDDGPGPYTARLLDVLKKYDVKVTFFVTGYNNNYNDMITRENEEGHTVALHSYTHNYSLIYSSIEAYMDDLTKIQDKVKEYANIESKILRFPGGSSNTVSRSYKVGIMSELTKKVEELGFQYFDWNISSGDAGGTTSTSKIVSNVTSALKEGRANVVLMHDIKSYSVDAVEDIIKYGLSNGYTFAPLTMTSPVIHQGVNN